MPYKSPETALALLFKWPGEHSMSSRLLKKMRGPRFRRSTLAGLVLSFFTILGFQNCAPPNKGFDTAASSSSTSNASGTAANASSSGGISGFGSTQVNSSSGSSSGGSSGTSTVGGFNTGGSSGGSSSGGSGGTSGSSSGSLQILKQPVSVTVMEGASFTLTVGVGGGTPPYTYQWYKDNAALGNGLGSFYFFSDEADRFSKEGNYYLKVKDSAGAVVTSTVVRVGITESQGPCDATQYMMFNAPSRDVTGNTFELFENSHGKYLINKNDPNVSWLNTQPGYFNVSYFNFTPALQNGQTANVSCSTQIDRIHDRQPNPEYPIEIYGGQAYADSYYWQYQGAVTFACHNQKYKLVSDSCHWVQVRPYPTDNGGGR